MKNLKIYFTTVLVSILSVACADKEVGHVAEETISISTKFTHKYSTLALKGGVYSNFFKPVDNKIGYSALKASPLQDYSIVRRALTDDENQQFFAINDEFVDTKIPFAKEDSFTQVFGSKMKFGISKNAIKGGQPKYEKEVEMYIPELVEIQNPKITNPEELMPSCYFEDFVLEWNADPNNKEGLVVMAEYFGDNVNPAKDTQEHILNTDIIAEDNGRTVLDKDLFEGIPNHAIVHLILLRGNFAIEELDGETYQLFAESHARLSIVLIRDLNTVRVQ